MPEEDEGKYICKWCGEPYETVQALGGHTRKKHKDKPSVESLQGKQMLGLEPGVTGVGVEKGEGFVSFFTGQGEKLFGELKDGGKRVSKKNIVTHFENGNIDSPDWMNYCLKIGGVDKAQRISIISTHYGINPVPVIEREAEYGQAEGIGGIPTKSKTIEQSPIDSVIEIAKKDFELAQLEHYTDRYRGKRMSDQPDNGNGGKVEIPLPSPFDPSQPLKDAQGNIVTTFVDPKQLMMQQQFGNSNLKGGNTEGGGAWDKAFTFAEKFIPKRGEGDDNMMNNPAFVALKEQLNAQKTQTDRIMDENKALKENQRLGQMEARIMNRIDGVESKTQSEMELWSRMTNVLRSEGLLPEGRGLFNMGGGTPEQQMAAETMGFVKDRANSVSRQVDKFGTIIASDVRQNMMSGKGAKGKTTLPKLKDSEYERIMEQIDESEGVAQETLE